MRPVDQPTLADYYRAATVTVVPSHTESFGLVAVESQACGTPVVAARVGGLRAAVDDGRSGLLVDGHDPAVPMPSQYQAHVTDATLKHRLARGAVAHAAGFGWGRTAQGILDVYAEALAVATPMSVVR